MGWGVYCNNLACISQEKWERYKLLFARDLKNSEWDNVHFRLRIMKAVVVSLNRWADESWDFGNHDL